MNDANKAEALINNLFLKYGNNLEDAGIIAKLLDTISTNLYTDSKRFIFELIQNADDFPNQSSTVNIKIDIFDEYLLFLHTGKPFDEKEVEALSSVNDSTKKNQTSTTGYKGIGFKSVFHHSECVYIYSGLYKFRYDKNFSLEFYRNQYKEEIRNIPWQLKPIWTSNEHLPEEIKKCSSFFEYSNFVAIALSIKSAKIDDYKSKVRELLSEPRLMLFLRNISLIEMSGKSNNESLALRLDRNKACNISEIYVNENIQSKWLVKDIEFDIPPEIQKNIQGQTAIPTKLQKSIRTKITFAAEIKNDSLTTLKFEESELFNYLPTNVKTYRFPFLVNADFLTIANREGLENDNLWNNFLFEKIGYLCFEFLQWISEHQPNYQKSIAELIPEIFNSSYRELLDPLKNSFNVGFETAIKDIAFIPSEETQQPLKVSEAIIDDTGITTIINSQIIKSSLGIKKYFVSQSLYNRNKIKNLGVEVFDFAKLVQFFKTESFKTSFTWEQYIALLLHLKKQNYESKLRQEQAALILAENDNLMASTLENPIYFQPSEDDKGLLTFDDFAFIHPALNSESKKNSDLHNCLIALGVQEFNPIEIIRKRIKNGQYEPRQNNVEAHINHIRFIFKYRSKLTEGEYQRLSNIKILHKIANKYDPAVASICYLSDYYQSNYPLESVAQDLGEEQFKFIVSDYCENPQNIPNWREFFLKINIIKPDGLDIIGRLIVPMIESQRINLNNTVKITRFIFSVIHNNVITNNELKSKLNNLLLQTSNGLKIATDCHLSEFYSPTSQDKDFLKEVNLPNLVSADYCINNELLDVWRQFFLSIGVQEVKSIELVRKKIQLLNNNPDYITPDNAIAITREIFNHRQELSQDDFEKLSKLKVLLKNGQLSDSIERYLANEYQPKQNLEDLFSTTEFDNFVSPEYIENNSQSSQWKEFFIKLKIDEQITIFRFQRTFSYDLANQWFGNYFAYVEHIEQIPYIDRNQNCSIDNAIFLTFYEDYQFLLKLWKYLIENWNNLAIVPDATIFMIGNQQYSIISPFEYCVVMSPSIPCTDGKCYPPIAVYSHSLKSDLVGCDLPVSAINFPAIIEEFAGIKRSLDVNACLEILKSISSSFSLEQETKQLLSIYEKLSNLIQNGINNSAQYYINKWKSKGQLLACDNLLHPIGELYYIDSELELPYNRNSKLVSFPEDYSNKAAFKTFLDFLGVKKITDTDIRTPENKESSCQIVHKQIKDRINYLSIYLINSTNQELVDERSNEILKTLEGIRIYNPSQLYYCIELINYEEHIHNSYDAVNNIIYYVGVWNSRKNAKLGEYLIKALKLESNKITSEKLLDFLDDPIEEVIKYLQDSGFDIPELLLSPPDENELLLVEQERILSTTIYIPNKVTGENPVFWGQWGEDKAKHFYEDTLKYKVIKQPDGTGYDFLCTKANNEIYAEVKAISSMNEIIRITRNEWQCMCRSENLEKYELLIVVHTGQAVEKIIRLKSAWLTLQEVLSKLSQPNITSSKYDSQEIEVLIGFQQSSNNKANDILLNWKRLLEQASSLTKNITIHKHYQEIWQL